MRIGEGQLQTWNRREVSSEWTECQAQLHWPKEKKIYDCWNVERNSANIAQ